MEGSGNLRERALDLRDELHEAVRELALADRTNPEPVRRIASTLTALEECLERGAPPPWQGNVKERLGACRMELERLRAGSVSRRDAVATLRLLLSGPPPKRRGRRRDAARGPSSEDPDAQEQARGDDEPVA